MTKKKKSTPTKKARTHKEVNKKDSNQPAAVSLADTPPKKRGIFTFRKPKTQIRRAIPSSRTLLRRSVDIMWQNKKVLGGVLLVYGVLQIVLVRGVLMSNFSEIKNAVDQNFDGFLGTATLFTYITSSFGSVSTAEAGVYQSFLFIVCSLAFIWALRQVMAKKVIRIRDAYYKGMYPLVPFILVLLVMGLQTIPALIGSWLYGTVLANEIAVTGFEQVFWLIVFLIFLAPSVYMICSSLFALYISTLPDMTPLQALRSARELVRYRRWAIIRKIAILSIVVLLVLALVLAPVILIIPVITPFIFYALTIVITGFVHTYLYSVYRELLLDD